MTRRLRLTDHARRQLELLALEEKDVWEIIGSFEESSFDWELGMTKVSKTIRGERVQVVFTAEEDHLIIVDVRLLR